MAVPLLFSFGVLGQVEVRIEDANGVEITGTLSLCKGQTKIVYAKKYVNDYLDPNAYNTGWFLDDIYVGSGGTSAPSYTITEQSNNKVLTFLMGPFVNGTGGTLSKKLSIHYYASPNDLYISGLTNVNVNSQQTYNILVGNGRQIHQNYFNATTFNATNNTVLIYPGYFYAYPFDIYANFKKTGITTLSATISQKSTAPCQTAIYTTQVTKTLDINVVDLVPPSTPSDLQVSNVNASSFTLSWSPSFDNYQVAGYKLYNGATLVATLPVSQTSYTFTTQAQYQLKVYAYDPSGNNSATAELGYLYDVLPPTAPTNVIATEVTGTRIALAWNDAIDNVRVAGYDIYINGNLVAANYLRTMYVANITQTPNTITIKAKDGNNNVSPFSLPLVVKKVDPFVIDTAIGNVGIGVNPPTQKLDVDGNVKVRGGKIIMQNPNTDSTNKIVYNAKGLAFSNLATRFSPLHLDNAVNVNGNLNLFGTGNAAGLYAVPTLFMNYNGKITSGGRMVLQEHMTEGNPTNALSSYGRMLLSNNLEWDAVQKKYHVLDNVKDVDLHMIRYENHGGMAFYTRNQFSSEYTNSETLPSYIDQATLDQKYRRMSITGHGTVVIGSQLTNVLEKIDASNQNDKLRVHGDTRMTGNLFVNGNKIDGTWSKVTGTQNIIYNSGNVGIGTTVPSTRLDVNGLGGANIDISTNGRIRSNNNDGGLWIANDRFVGGHSTNKIGFYSNGDWRMTIQNDGNIGIGTTAPTAKLHVVGTINATGLQINGVAVISSQWANVTGGISYNGNVIIGTRATKIGTDSDYKLAVDGKIVAQKVIVTDQGWSDRVFDSTYNLLSLHETEKYIIQNKHLPNIPSEKELSVKGLDTGEMLKLQMAKIEELTLHLIQQDKKIKELEVQLLKK